MRMSKGYPGADCGNDHALIMAEIVLKHVPKSKKCAKHDWKLPKTDTVL